MNLKDITVNIFQTVASDDDSLSLIEVPLIDVGGTLTRTMKSIREQIIEDKYPSDLIYNNLTRLCVY